MDTDCHTTLDGVLDGVVSSISLPGEGKILGVLNPDLRNFLLVGTFVSDVIDSDDDHPCHSFGSKSFSNSSSSINACTAGGKTILGVLRIPITTLPFVAGSCSTKYDST